MLVDFCHGVDGAGFLDVEANHFDGILFLINVVYGFVNFAKTSLTNKDDVFEFLFESTSVQDVVER